MPFKAKAYKKSTNIIFRIHKETKTKFQEKLSKYNIGMSYLIEYFMLSILKDDERAMSLFDEAKNKLDAGFGVDEMEENEINEIYAMIEGLEDK